MSLLQLLEGIQIPPFLGFTVLAVACIAVLRLIGNGHPEYPTFPRIGKGFLEPWIRLHSPARAFRLQEYEQEGYEKYSKKGIPFVVNMYGIDAMILPPKYLPAIKNYDPDKLSFAQALHDVGLRIRWP